MNSRFLLAATLVTGAPMLAGHLLACKSSSRADGKAVGTTPASAANGSAPSLANGSAPSLANGSAPSLYDLSVRRLDGSPAPLSAYRGKVALLVNVASECGYTSQYQGLQSLYEELEPRGFVVLGFPSNDFGEQEPGSPQEIAAFAANTYKVKFPLFEKVKTQGAETSPVYALAAKTEGPPRWNFHKYLVDKKGVIVRSFPSRVAPESEELRAAIRSALEAT